MQRKLTTVSFTFALLLIVALSTVATGAATADTEIATISKPAPISAFGERIVWSEYDAAAKNYKLMTQIKGNTSAVEISPRTVPFDVDLGPNIEDKTVAAYSRCKKEPGGGSSSWETGSGCDIYTFNFSNGKESKVSKANSASASEFLPSIWKKRVAFARKYRGKTTRLYTRDLTSSKPSKRLARGTLHICTGSKARGNRKCSNVDDPAPNSIDLYGRRAAFVWEYGGAGEGPTYEVILSPVKGRPKKLDSGTTGISTDVYFNPTFSKGWLYYAETCGGDPSPCSQRQRFHRYRVKNGSKQEARAPANLLGFTRGASDIYYEQAADENVEDIGDGCPGEVTPASPGLCSIMKASTPRFK